MLGEKVKCLDAFLCTSVEEVGGLKDVSVSLRKRAEQINKHSDKHI